jgi:serine/threonine protein kinase
MSTWDPFEPVPEVVGDRYRLDVVLGEGGAGIVYAATDTSTGTGVAIKLVQAPALSKPVRFLAEMRDMARLDHPRIVRLLDAGKTGDGRLDPFRALELTYQILQGLHAVHAAQLIHRDVKPHNVLLDDAGNAHLTDFGLARHVGGDVPWRTRTGESLGSPTYRSPEQTRNPAEAGREADVYGVGGTLYFLVTGRKPGYFYMLHESEYAREMAGLDPAIAAIVRKATATLPEERYRTAIEMASACAFAADGLPGRTGKPPVARTWIASFESAGPTPTWWGRLTGWWHGA